MRARGLSKDQADASEAIRGEEVCSICEDTRVQTGTAELQKGHTALGTPAFMFKPLIRWGRGVDLALITIWSTTV